MATETKKAFCLLWFHSSKSVTAVKHGFPRRFHESYPCANAAPFLGLSRHFAAMSRAVLLLPDAAKMFEVLIPMAFYFCLPFIFGCIDVRNCLHHLY
jgi:hypothetical protein